MKALFFFCLMLLFTKATFAQHVKKLDPHTMELIEDIIEHYVWDLNVPGMAVGVIQDGQIAFTHSEGNAKTNPDTAPFLSSTRSLLASVSKPITAVIAMRLMQEGHMELDTTIDNYISGYANTSITVRHLLAHQSGIGHYSNCSGGYNGQWDAEESIQSVLECDYCITPPGSGTWYTTFGTTLLGSVIESIGMEEYNQGFIALYNTWIKNPAGLTSLNPSYNNSDPLLAQGHDGNGDGEIGNWNDIGWKLPAGGFTSNILDLAKFGIGVMNYTFLDSIHSNLMWQLQNTNGTPNINCDDSSDNPYGLGWVVNGSGSNLVLSHNGVNEDHGYRARIELYPNLKKGIVVLMNQNREDIIAPMLNQIRPLVLCPASRNFTAEINWDGLWSYQSSNTIVANIVISNASANITFDAQNSIRLSAGFNAMAGIDFRALINGCE